MPGDWPGIGAEGARRPEDQPLSFIPLGSRWAERDVNHGFAGLEQPPGRAGGARVLSQPEQARAQAPLVFPDGDPKGDHQIILGGKPSIPLAYPTR